MVHHVCSLGVGALARGSDGSVIIGGGDGTLNVFDWENMRTEVPPPVLHGSITSLSVDHGDVVIAGTSEGDIFKVSDGLERAVPLLQTQRGELNHLCFDANDGSTFSSTSTDGSICVWSSRAGGHSCFRDPGLINLKAVLQDRQLLHRLRKPAFGSATSSRVLDGFVLSGWSDGHLRRHDLAPGHPEIWVIPNAHKFGNSTGVSAMCLGARGDLVISGGMRGDIRVWDLASRGLVAQLKQHMGAVTAVRAFADNSHALSCSEDQSIKLWDFAAEKCLTSFVTKMGAIHDIDLVADQVQFVSVGKDRCLTFWDLREPRPTQVVRLWDFRTGSAIASLPGHTGRVSTVTFSPDGSALLSASDNGSLVWWEL
ncbi:unnamed protein product [Ostreobium quekettii]|uniref:Guanine nucleotide-binding protein subunit beta-like protein n=1 Tax=Ostreobium quekettii TaxID=121088 RepID=A0A8S1J4R2_9CHLO|nr:unnamed protein product [Ostreobium quekettii]